MRDKYKHTKNTPELNEKIIKLFDEGWHVPAIKKETGASDSYVRNLIRSTGRSTKRSYPKHNYQEIVDYNEQIKDSAETMKHFNVSETCLRYILKLKNGTYYRTPIKLTYDNTIFDIIDTEEKAYWLGFIYADGYISEQKDHTFEISLNIKDIDHLHKFNKFIKSEKDLVKIDVKNGRNRCRIAVHNLHFWKSLNKLGVMPRKSLILTFPDENIVPKNLLIHFIRGYFDGDGCIMTNKTSVDKLQTSFMGTKNMMESFQNYFGTNKKLIVHKTKNGEVYYLRFRILQSIKILQKMYNNASIYLDRKFQIWDDYCQSNKKLLETLESKFGEDWDVNPEVIKFVNYTWYCNA